MGIIVFVKTILELFINPWAFIWGDRLLFGTDIYHYLA